MARTPLYQAVGSRILNRARHPEWMTAEQGRALLASHVECAITSDDPEAHLSAIKAMVMALREVKPAAADALIALSELSPTIEKKAA